MKKNSKYFSIAAILSVVIALMFTVSACSNDKHEHVLQNISAVEATCDKEGNIEYWKCVNDECKKIFSDAKGEKEITDIATTIIAAKGHTIIHIDAKAATCAIPGNVEYWKCSSCGKLYSDADGKTETTAAGVKVVVEHTYGADWKSNAVEHWHECSVCEIAKKDTANHTLAMEITGGQREYNKNEPLNVTELKGIVTCSICNYRKEVDIKASMVTGFDSAEIGAQTLTVTYFGKAGNEATKVVGTYDVTIKPETIKYTLSLQYATFADDAVSVEIEGGGVLPSGIKYTTGKTHKGWYDRVNNVYYTNDSFKMPFVSATLTAVYAEDLEKVFTPACVFEDMSGPTKGTQHTTEHVVISEGVQATKYEIVGGCAQDFGIKILNGDSLVLDGCDNGCPITKEHGNFVLMTFTNNGKSAVAFKYQVEYWGVIGEAEVSLNAGETKEIPLVYAMTTKSPRPSAFNQLVFTSAVEGDVSLTIYGKRYDENFFEKDKPHTLTLVGATYDNNATVSLDFNAVLTGASLLATSSEKTLIGWKDEIKGAYLTKEELATNFKMPSKDTTITAVYLEDMALFTPSCTYADKSKGDAGKLTGTHSPEGATTYAIDKSVAEWLIYNSGSDEKHDVSNDCPVSATISKLYYMTFSNDGAEALNIKIGPECYGLKYPVSVTIPANGSISVPMIIGTIMDQSRTFWQINNESVGEGSVNLTIIGHIA